MMIYGDPDLEGQTYIYVSATNRGNIPTTLLTPALLYYKNWWSWVKSWRPFKDQKPDESYFVKEPGIGIYHGYKLPYLIQPGTIWQGLVKQDKKVEKLAKEGLLFFALYSSHKGKAVMVKVRYRVIPKPVISNTDGHNLTKH